MESNQQRPPKIRYIALIALIVLVIGVVFYRFVEGWTWVDSFYFCVVTLATVGYGDIVPVTEAGRLFTSFYILIGIGIFAVSINFIIKHAAMRRLQRFQDKHPDKLQTKRTD